MDNKDIYLENLKELKNCWMSFGVSHQMLIQELLDLLISKREDELNEKGDN